jgi:hypothetical protein
MPKSAAKPANVESAPIQFESADFGAAAAPSTCGNCNTPLAGAYWAVNGSAVCERCRMALAAPVESGGGLGRFVRGGALGAVAGAAGSFVYFAVGYLTGYEFSLLAILVGWLVGTGVRRGSGGRGGFAYQALAVVLTYVAIASTSIPAIVTGIREEMAQHHAATTQAQPATVDPDDAAADVAPDAAPMPDVADRGPGSAFDVVVAAAFLVVFACALPFLDATGNPIGLLIIVIGLHQAWTMNRRTKLEITGPHALAPANR